MITMETDRLVDEYLRRLEAAAAHLPRARRAELVAEIREHIETALQQEDDTREGTVRNVLERLGPPEEIVDAAEPLPATDGHGRAGKLEIAALVVLVVPIIGWLVGTVLVSVSQAWSHRDKLVGFALMLLPVMLPLIVIVAAGESGSDEQVPGEDTPVGVQESGDSGLGSLELAVLIFLFVGGLPTALYLGWRLRRTPIAG